MSELKNLTIKDAKKLLEKKEISCVELTQHFLDRATKQNPELNAYTVITSDLALKQAAASQKKYDAGSNGIMEGIPVGIKDLFCTKGVASTACSKILKGFTPEYESTVSQNLFDNGAVMLGKLNMDEFAMGSSNLTSCEGPVKSPWKRERDGKDVVPGGSSGGSSSAVAARICMGATGSDTGGSIRQPAAFTGVFGMKPTYGRCSRYGMIAFSSSLDQAGVLTNGVEDGAIMLQAMAGHDPKDSTSSPEKLPDFSSMIGKDLKGMKIGLPKEYRMDGMPSEIDEIWQKGAAWLKEHGAEVIEISLPHTKYALPTYYIISSAEASSNLARYDGVRYGTRVSPEKANINEMYEATRSAGFGAEVKRRIMIGTYVLSSGFYDAYYSKGQKVRRKILNDFQQAFQNVDAILTPTAPSEAFALDEKMDDPIKMYLNDVFTVPASLAGIPGASIPVQLGKDKLPLGLQVLGKHFDEVNVFRVSRCLEISANFKGL